MIALEGVLTSSCGVQVELLQSIDGPTKVVEGGDGIFQVWE